LRCALCCGNTETRIRHILLLKREAELVSEATSRSIEEFATEVESREPYIYEMRKTCKEGKCIFLEDNQCKIYSLRPLICRFYPFELKVTNNRRHEFRHTDECPGIGKGKQPLKKEFFKNLLRQI
jgi:Fe-S-cluster containining protein